VPQEEVDDALSRYMEFAKATFPNTMRLDHLKILIDLRKWRCL
jgi:Phosphomannomutase